MACWCCGVALAGRIAPRVGTRQPFDAVELAGWQLLAVALLLTAAACRARGAAIAAFVAVVALFPLGYLAGTASERPAPLLQVADLPSGLDGPWRVVARLLREPEPTETGSRLLLDVERVLVPQRRGPRRWAEWTGRVELSVAGGRPSPTGIGRGLLPGATVEAFLAFRRDRPPANPGRATNDRLRSRGIDLRANLKSLSQLRLRAPPTAMGRAMATIRNRLRAAIDRRFRPSHRPLVSALLLGERGRVADSTAVRMAGAGLAHVLSISGLHVGLIAVAAVGAVRVAGAPPRTAAAVGLAATGLLAAVVAPRPPVRRAAIMAASLLGGRLVDRRGSPAEALALAVGLLVWQRPTVLSDPGFQLSAVATAGLIGLVPAAGNRPAGRIAAALAAPAAAQGAIAPLLARRASAVPLAGLFLNPLVVPLLGLLLPVLLAAVLLEAVGASRLATGAAAIGGAGLDLLLALAADGYPRAVLLLPAFGLAAMASWAAGLALIAWTRRRDARAGGTVLLLAGLLIAGRSAGPVVPRLVALDVGQGDALLVQSRGGAALIDGGGYPGIDWDIGAHLVVPALRALDVRSLDLVALTHPHADHAGGLPAVLAAIPTRQLWLGAAPASAPSVRRVLDAAQTGETIALTPWRPRRLAGCRWEPLTPPTTVLRRAGSEIDNEASLALSVRCAGSDLLLTGDAGVEVEPGWPLDRLGGAVLKVGHHGSSTATATATVRQLRPRIAVVSVGARNPFGLPRDEVLDRLRTTGTALYRTDRDGALTVTLAGRRTIRGERWSSGSGERR